MLTGALVSYNNNAGKFQVTLSADRHVIRERFDEWQLALTRLLKACSLWREFLGAWQSILREQPCRFSVEFSGKGRGIKESKWH